MAVGSHAACSTSFDDLLVSDKLLHSKTKVSAKATEEELNKIWASFPENSNVDEEELNVQTSNCQSPDSLWVFRQTPPIRHDYNISEVLGHPGQYGVVRLITPIANQENKKCVYQPYACKVISKHRFRDRLIKQSFFEDIRVECHLLAATSDHPHIVECYQVYEDIQNVYMVMSCCNGGELFDRIASDYGFNELCASRLFRQMVSATYYIHQRGIAHCDMKPENFLFRSKDKNSSIALIDFGMAKIVSFRKYHKRLNGTPYYIAPEVLDGHYNESCDMWSLGVILFIMIYGFPPFFDPDEAQNEREQSDHVIYKNIRKGFIPKVLPNYGNWFPSEHPISGACRDLISRLLRTNVADRMTAEEALEHPFLKPNQHQDPLAASKLHRTQFFSPTLIRSLQSYKQHSRLQSEILKILRECNYLNVSQMKSVKEFFQAMDKNGDGLISHQELYEALSTIDTDVTLNDAKSILHSLDANNDGFLDWDELLSSRINRKLQSKEERLRKVFKALDLDNSGKISADELKAALESINEGTNVTIGQCMELIKDVDLDADGEVDFEEFITMFQHQTF